MCFYRIAENLGLEFMIQYPVEQNALFSFQIFLLMIPKKH